MLEELRCQIHKKELSDLLDQNRVLEENSELQCQIHKKELSDLLETNRVLEQNLGRAEDLIAKMEREREENAPPGYENVVENQQKIPEHMGPVATDDGMGQVHDQSVRRKTERRNWVRRLLNRLK